MDELLRLVFLCGVFLVRHTSHAQPLQKLFEELTSRNTLRVTRVRILRLEGQYDVLAFLEFL